MMASQAEEESPLIAALPPQTDYITYLTILEYQLTSSNLPILTSLLNDDDGTLAKEIGWDLLKLVLPLSEEVPEEATKCLEVVARRGNPREVVVRVAEELERLDRGDMDVSSGPDQDFEDDQDDDGLRTFEGEAERIHLGTLSLDGMPPPSGQTPSKEMLDLEDDKRLKPSDSNDAVLTKFRILLSMLSILHPRIQTKYPSRFLATSLPAALASYRRLPISVTTTIAFVSLLGKLSGKQRPTLPPRASTTTVGAAVPPNSAVSADTRSAPLPDPEAQSESIGLMALSAEEAAIIRRLLQAVLLEVLEEYVQSLATKERSSMSWTARLRESREPKKIVPGRQTETEKWRTDPALQERDTLIAKFVRLSKDLDLDIKKICQQAFNPETVATETVDSEASAADAESPSEYPTSPDQISFSKTGVLLLFVAEHVASPATTPSQRDDIAIDEVFPNLVHLCQSIEDPSEHPALRTAPSTSILDALLTILYTSARTGSTNQPSSTLVFLTSLCAENPDPYIRDSAHAVATIIFHHCPPDTKISFIKDIVTTSSHPNLRAVVVNWLKDEFAQHDQHEQHDQEASNLQPKFLTAESSEPELRQALFSPPPTADSLLAQLPFYVAVLNFTTIAPLPSAEPLVQTLLELRNTINDEEVEEHGVRPVDLWSLDDALQRARDAFAKAG
jgi:hypothetical protein